MTPCIRMPLNSAKLARDDSEILRVAGEIEVNVQAAADKVGAFPEGPADVVVVSVEKILDRFFPDTVFIPVGACAVNVCPRCNGDQLGIRSLGAMNEEYQAICLRCAAEQLVREELGIRRAPL